MSPDGLLTEIEACHQWEAALAGRRLAAVAALIEHRACEAEAEDGEPGYCLITGLRRAAAEVGAALNLPASAAGDMVAHAEALHDRLPHLAALLRQGQVDWPTVRAVLNRTTHVTPEAMTVLDTRITTAIASWDTWSPQRVRNTVDRLIQELDAEAAKDRRVRAEAGRHVTVTAGPDGTVRIRATLPAADGAVVHQRLATDATAVCAGDSRTVRQRRADAFTAVFGNQPLACDCGNPDCPHTSDEQSAGPRIVINVLTTEATLTGASAAPGYLAGFGVIDADQVRTLAETPTAVRRTLTRPTVTAAQAHTYRPSAAVARWVTMRDLTCRFPGCDRPAWQADLDHTRAFNHTDPTTGGLTVPTNLGCYCREHHRDKTFLDWTDTQLPDGSIEWISPTGRRYRTTALGAELFPEVFGPPPPPRRRNPTNDKARRTTHQRRQLTEQRPVNAEARRIAAARRREITLRRHRNDTRRRLHLFKGTPSTSPLCTWVNQPLEPETLPPDWQPPPTPNLTDDPPF
jgi:hypothetical protein